MRKSLCTDPFGTARGRMTSVCFTPALVYDMRQSVVGVRARRGRPSSGVAQCHMSNRRVPRRLSHRVACGLNSSRGVSQSVSQSGGRSVDWLRHDRKRPSPCRIRPAVRPPLAVMSSCDCQLRAAKHTKQSRRHCRGRTGAASISCSMHCEPLTLLQQTTDTTDTTDLTQTHNKNNNNNSSRNSSSNSNSSRNVPLSVFVPNRNHSLKSQRNGIAKGGVDAAAAAVVIVTVVAPLVPTVRLLLLLRPSRRNCFRSCRPTRRQRRGRAGVCVCMP